jgi:hypothetical protein
LQVLANTEQTMRFAHQPKIKFELSLVHLASMDTALDAGALIHAIKDLKSGIKSGNIAQAPAIAPSPQHAPQTAPSRSAFTLSDKPIANPFPQPEPKKPSVPAPQPALNEPAPPTEPKVHCEERPAEPPAPKLNGNSQAILRDNWTAFKNKFVSTVPGLQILSDDDTVRAEFADGEITFAVGDKFIADILKKHKTKLADSLLAFYGKEIALKFEVKAPADSVAPVDIAVTESAHREIAETKEKPDFAQIRSAKDQSKPKTAPEKKEKASVEGKHETEKAIINLFDAVEIK